VKVVFACQLLIYVCICTETKRARSELKKRSTDTLRMQKKARKGLTSTSSSSSLAQGITAAMDPLDSQQRLLQSGIQQLGECEGKSVRAALTEGRGRFCIFVTLLRPVLVS
jgi:metastasis suppressor protein 1